MMLSKKNSETLENFSEKLEVEGRSLWQDARRRFMHNRAAVASLIVLVLIALFVILACRCFRNLLMTVQPLLGNHVQRPGYGIWSLLRY